MKSYKCLASLYAIGSIGFAAQVSAQGVAADSKGNLELEEIIVTATRVETPLSKTPLAVTAVTSEQLTSQGITRTDQLAEVVPNLILNTGDRGRMDITIRGVSSPDNTEKGDSSAAVMVDGVYYARPEMQNMSFLDLQRVEVLRGPQGTLFGRNATAGVINFITARPNTDAFSGSVNASYGNYNAYTINSAANLPINDRFAVRLAAGIERSDTNKNVAQTIPANAPFAASPTYNTGTKYDMNPSVDNFAARVSILAKLADNVELVLRTDYGTTKGIGFASASVPSSNFFDFSDLNNIRYISGRSTKEYLTIYSPPAKPINDAKTSGVSGELTIDTIAGQLTYIGSYRGYDKKQETGFFPGSFVTARNIENANYYQNSHELRLAFLQGQRFSGQAGLYSFYEESAITSGFPYGFIGGTQVFIQDPTINRNQGIFAQTIYKILDNLNLTTGARYSKDVKSRDGVTINPLLPPTNPPTPDYQVVNANIARSESSKITWRVGLDYDIPGLGLLYGSIATGYKAGAFNNGCVQRFVGDTQCTLTDAALQLYYKPETLTAYEAGTKFNFLDRRVGLTTAAYYYDYRDLQRNTALDLNGDGDTVDIGEAGTRNAKKAKVYGLETALNVLATTSDRVDVTLNLQRAKYVEYTPAPGIDRSGYEFDNTPKTSGSLDYTHTFNFGAAGSIDANAGVRYTSETVFVADISTANPKFLRQPSYTKSHVRLRWDSENRNWNVEAFVNNIEDKIVLTSAGVPATFGPFTAYGLAGVQEPRTYGVRAGYKF